MKRLFTFLVLQCCFFASASASISPEYLLRNNTEHRKYLRGVTVHQTISFKEGFYTPNTFSCEETISFKNIYTYRIDYTCNSTPYTLLKIGGHYQSIYNKQISKMNEHHPSFLFGLFFFKKPRDIFKILSNAGFVNAEIVKRESKENESKDSAEKPKKEDPEWTVSATIGLTRLDKIEKSTPEKMEKNTVYLLTSSNDEDQKIWFDKDLFLPQKIAFKGKNIQIQNYREVSNKLKRFFRYPHKIDIMEDETTGISIEANFDKLEVNPKFEPDHFEAKSIVKKRRRAFPNGSEIETVLLKFIEDFR